MSPLLLQATKATPEIVLDSTGTCLIKGMSIPENAAEFYAPVLEWMEAFLATTPAGVHFRFDLNYFNSSSLKALYMLLAQLKEAQQDGIAIHIAWVVEDEDEFMLEASSYFADLLCLTMSIEHVPARDRRGERKAS